MRQLTAVLFCFLLLCANPWSLARSATEGTMLSVEFAEPDLGVTESGSGFQFVTVKGLDLSNIPGEPCLPVKVVQLYVPRGKEVSRVVVEAVSQVSLPGRYLVLPGQHQVPLSPANLAGGAAPEPVAPDPAIYSSNVPFPSTPVIMGAMGSMAGRKIASLKVFPVQYVPAEGRLVLNEKIDFRLEFTEAAPAEPAAPKETPSVARQRNAIVARMVENAGDIETDFPEYTATLEGPSAAEYLIICHELHVDECALLRDWKTRKGVPAAIKTWQEIVATYAGVDDAEKVRNCIKDYYLNHSTMWVAIAGTAPKASSYLRGCYCDVYGTVDAAIPCDLYFSDLDGTWNNDNDSYWGETTDGTDLYPDVYVGRLPVNTGVQCSTAVHKVLTYEGCYSVPTDYQRHMAFMGEWLDAETDAAINKNMIDNESVPARFDPIEKLYESTGTLDHASAMAALNSGKGIVNHDGHGNVSIVSIGSGVLSMDDFMALTNAPRYTVFYTLACDPGAFDVVMGCLGRSFVESPNGGGFFVGNSRYGWYWPGQSGYGTGDVYDREFFKSMFVRGLSNLGAIHADAKVRRIPYSAYDDSDRWTQFSLNLLGDPETPVWTDTPKTVTVSHPAGAETGEGTFSVSVSSSGSPVAQARVCLWKGNDVYAVDETAADGGVAFAISPADTGTMLVTVSRVGYLPYLGSAYVEEGLSGVAGGESGAAIGLKVAPNPVTTSATVFLSLPGPGPNAPGEPARAGIFDVRGRKVAELAATEGSARKLVWDCRAEGGTRVPPGIYFVRVWRGEASAEAKLMVLR